MYQIASYTVFYYLGIYVQRQTPKSTPNHHSSENLPLSHAVPYIYQPKSQTDRDVPTARFRRMFLHPMPSLIFLVSSMHRAHREKYSIFQCIATERKVASHGDQF